MESQLFPSIVFIVLPNTTSQTKLFGYHRQKVIDQSYSFQLWPSESHPYDGEIG